MKKKLFCALSALTLLLMSCGNPGDLKLVSSVNDTKVEIYKYWISESEYVYIGRFKDQPKTTTTTWEVGSGNSRRDVYSMNNDSITQE